MELRKNSRRSVRILENGVINMETLDLTGKLPDIDISTDREFDAKFIGDAMNHLKKIRDNSMDYIANPNNLTTIQRAGEDEWDLWVETEDRIKVFKPTPYAKTQTIGVTELPKKYHDTLVEKGHINEAINHLNMWLHEGNPHRVRTVGGTYRALVSPSYLPFDNYDAFVSIANAVKAANTMRDSTTKPVQFKKCQLSDHNMYIQLIDEGREWDLGKGDTYKPLMVFKNSEVGDGAMTVEAGLWRSMCSNLSLHGVVSRRIHKGEKLNEGIFAPDTISTQNELWKKVVRDSINAGIANDALYDEVIAGILETKETKIENPVASVAIIAKENKLTKSEEDAIIAAMMGDTTVTPEEKNTVFQVMNGMTQAAKGFGIERGREVAQMAGNTRQLMKVLA